MTTTSDEFSECPLCMEGFEIDDLNFFPCTCGYQICRFCWHRLRTDENGLCPACRKSYPEDPAQFKPLTDEEVHKIKKDRRQKETQRKQKSAENRKHLANVRVVQKNLVFVVGLAPRLTDPEVLKRHEYFGRFGKIHKVVINQSTSYVGSQGPSASAYVTYVRPEDALNAIRFVNNAQVDGRTIKASLGTTKYCSHFLKGTQCMKPDCMYLHDLGDEAASFTKEEIQQGKHVQYEQKLSEQYLSSTHSSNNVIDTGVKTQTKTKETSPSSSGQLSPTVSSSLESSNSTGSSESVMQVGQQMTPPLPNGSIKAVTITGPSSATVTSSSPPVNNLPTPASLPQNTGLVGGVRPLPFTISTSSSDHLSLFSDNAFLSNRISKPVEPVIVVSTQAEEQSQPKTTDGANTETNIVKNSVDVWQETVGCLNLNNTDTQDDDLGFDPYVVSAKGLADMIENEKATNSIQSSHMVPPLSNSLPRFHSNNSQMLSNALRSKILPPGFAPPVPQPAPPALNGYIQHPSNASQLIQPQSSKMLNFMQLSPGMTPTAGSLPPPHHHHLYGSDQLVFGRKLDNSTICYPLHSSVASHQSNSLFNMQEWQDGLKALLPNINISFGTQSLSSQREFGSLGPGGPGLNPRPVMPMHSFQGYPAVAGKNWCSSSSLASHSMPDLSWDPAIINTGAVADANLVEEPPHWMASLHHLTDDYHSSTAMMHPSHSMSWLPQPSAARFPPPGFANSNTSTRQMVMDKQNLTDYKLPAS